MSYTPNNAQVYAYAFAGAMSAFGSSAPLGATAQAAYIRQANASAALAQAIDIAWLNAANPTPNVYDVASISAGCALAMRDRDVLRGAPGGKDQTNYDSPANWTNQAIAIVVATLQGDATAAALGITFPPIGSGGFTAGGDLAGTSVSQTVIGLQNNPILAGTPSADGQVPAWSVSLSKFVFRNLTGADLTGAAQIKLPFDKNGEISTTSVAAGEDCTICYVDISSAFDAGTLTITVGGAVIATAGEAIITQIGTYQISPKPGWISLPSGVLTASIAGGPTTGAGKIIFRASNSNS